MDLGLQFDDEDFELETQNGLEVKKPYNAKLCSKFWYQTETPEPDNAGIIFKFRGDNLYHQKNYTAAIDVYKEGLESLPPNNKALRQDILECMARCYLHTDKLAEALDIAQRLVTEAKSFDQTMQTRLLLSQVQEKMTDIEGLEESLKILLTMHPFTYSFWLKLGHCYQVKLEQEDINHSKRLKRLTCIVRARLLLRNIMRNSGSFFKEKLTALLKETEELQSQLGIADDVIEMAAKHLTEDIHQNENDNQEQSDLKDLSDEDISSVLKAFDQRWFSWIQKENITLKHCHGND